MPQLSVAFISSIANFREQVPTVEALKQMEPFEQQTESGRDLADSHAERFAALCNTELKSLIAEHCPELVTLRVAEGYGWVEGRKHWLRLGADLHVDEAEALLALEILKDPMFAGVFDFRIERATSTFVNQDLPSGLFEELSCSFNVYEEPEQV